MAQPDLIPMPFAENATPGTIEPIPATTPTVPQGATWSTGFPQVTMQPLAAGGIPPRGQNFNGVLNALSRHIFHMQGGGQYKWSDDHGPYSIGDVLQSDDGLRAYVSVVDNNTDNFNTNPASIGVSWLPWGGGAASELVAGLVRFGTSAGTAAQGNDSRIVNALQKDNNLSDITNPATARNNLGLGTAATRDIGGVGIGVGQTWQDVTGSRGANTTYTNTTGRPIEVAVTYWREDGDNAAEHTFNVNDKEVGRSVTRYTSNEKASFTSVIVPAGASYSATKTNGTLYRWMELR